MNGLGSFKRKLQAVVMAAMSVGWSVVMLSHTARATEPVTHSNLPTGFKAHRLSQHGCKTRCRLPRAARPYSCHAWAKAGQWELAQACIDHKSINMKDARGRTLLHWAVRQRNLAEVVTLVDKGANGSIADRKHVSPLQLAKKMAKQEDEDGEVGQRMLQVMRSALRPRRLIVAAASSPAEAPPQVEPNALSAPALVRGHSLGGAASEPTLPPGTSAMNLQHELFFEQTSMGQVLFNQGSSQRNKPAEESGNSSAGGGSAYDYVHGPRFSCDGSSNDYHC